MEIQDSEKRRAQNLIWNAAEDYSFTPDFKAYDENGRADLYWNSIIGAARRICGEAALHTLFSSFHGCLDESLYEQLVWLGLENAVYQREAARRPALPALRRSYARRVLALSRAAESDRLLDVLQEAHFRRALGQTPALRPRDQEILDALEFSGDLDGAALTEQALWFLRTYFGFVPVETQAREAEEEKKKRRVFSLRKRHRADLPAVRGFGYGFGEHILSEGGGKDASQPQRRITDLTAAQSEEALRAYIAAYFGTPLYPPRQVKALEDALCVDGHKGCHLYYAKGDAVLDPTVRGYAGSQRRAALKQMEKNRAAYEADSVRNRNSILRLTARIRNALMAYLQPTVIRSAVGTLDAGRIWRGVYLDDDKVFTRVMQSDPGTLCVDLLLDSSTSQLDRQETVAAQGYMIAESLTRCGVPVRVSSFCSLSGYTILTRYRDYFEKDQNQRIFHYFTTGCNRDGLAIRALCREMADAPCEHKLVILLSDAKPHDVNKLVDGPRLLEYADEAGIGNTAAEVRSLLYQDISVVCVFTGDDEDVPAAHTIYGRNFARIRSLDQFADTVGTLIQNQIRSL
ncbi:hypothetical protein SAMN05216343_12624 [Oscillibacter sp. PC13]|uniref:hypothetical protein n=1 Tax=Oscillibacter sp. PC13 TaxID=1855299 RepID=UPI0008E16C4C|nr:hypothetical protein [Oscillibacter sp. PC13]SFQ14464.1 hypothetical protein SAMN05216343_12624 [Oscillibacter sp. PC13]